MSNNFVKNRLGHHNKLHAQAKDSKRNDVFSFDNHNNTKAELLEKLKEKQKSKLMDEQ